MTAQEQLDREVAEYNQLVGAAAGLQEQLKQMEEDRLRRLGRIQILSEMASREAGQDGQGDAAKLVVPEAKRG